MNETSAKKRVAIVGSGVAGVSAALLLQAKYQVTVFEREKRIGGHTNTVVITDGPDAGVAVDTGFIVLNNRTYPTFHRFLKRLKVEVRDACMSFGYFSEPRGFYYAGTNLNGMFAQRSNLCKPWFWKFLLEIGKFGKSGAQALENNSCNDLSLRDFLKKNSFSPTLIDDYVVPIGAAIWSAPLEGILEFPAETFLRFFSNHGLLNLSDRPIWQTVKGGSHQYLKAFEAQFSGKIVTDAGIAKIRRNREQGNVSIEFLDGRIENFDLLIIATHADQALLLLDDPSPEESALLGAWSYQHNRTVLHTDISFLPPVRRAWASWNYRRDKGLAAHDPVSVTYYMNHLQGLNARKDYSVTLNPNRSFASGSVVTEIDYTHPVFTREAINSQNGLRAINGKNSTWFCGSYFGYGFHEDAIKSSVEVGEALGVSL